MALSISNKRRLITNSTANNNTPLNNNSFSSNKQNSRLYNTSNSPNDQTSKSKVKTTNASNTENSNTSLALNKEKRQVGIKQENGYLNGTAATSAKTKRPINQVHDSSQIKKSKLLKTNHLQNRSNNNSSTNNSSSNFQINNNLKQNRSNGKFYVKNSDENSKISGKKFLNKTQKSQHQEEEIINKAFDENESETPYDFNSKEEYTLGEQFYEHQLKKLNEQLRELTNLDNSCPPSSTTTINGYYDEVNKLEKESKETLDIIKIVYEKQKNEIEQQYLNEYNKAVQDYHDKRREIKENLKNEHEEMRKQIDIDRNCLDINADITDPKSVPTRNLRRRQNANTTLNMTANFELDADVDTSILIQNNVMSANLINVHGGSTVSIVNNGLSVVNSSTSMILGQYSGSSLNHYHPNSLSSLYSAIVNSSALANSLISQGINDRKRKLNPPSAITFTINEEEMNEDLKYLMKNLNNHTLTNQTKNALTVSSSSTSVSSSVASPKLTQNVNEVN